MVMDFYTHFFKIDYNYFLFKLGTNFNMILNQENFFIVIYAEYLPNLYFKGIIHQ